MIGSMPPAKILAEQFFIDFFQSLWERNSMCFNSPGDRAALFTAMKECFMWIVNNASRSGHFIFFVKSCLSMDVGLCCMSFSSIFEPTKISCNP